jgi:nucleoid-associated protein YgaU
MKALRIAIFLLLIATAVGAQSLLDDPTYRSLVDEAESLRAQAATAIDEGRYDDAVTLSEQAEAKAAEAEAYAANIVLAFRANGWFNRARQRVRYVESINGPDNFPEEYALATGYLDDAAAAFESEEWQSAIDASRLVMSALEDVQIVRSAPAEPEPVAEPEPEPEPEPQPVVVEPEPEPEPEPQPAVVLPRYYVVELVESARDCFWRIAGFDFVYGDPWQWPVLYEANKHNLPDPENEDLMWPGMVIEIPSISGEIRSGIYNPEELPANKRYRNN